MKGGDSSCGLGPSTDGTTPSSTSSPVLTELGPIQKFSC